MNNIETEIASLIKSYKGYGGEITIEPFKRTGNNKTFVVTFNNEKYFVKNFFNNAKDLRDRYDSELNFIRFAERFAPFYVPAIYKANREKRLILYEFVNGTPFSAIPVIEEKHVWQAVSFFKKLNMHKKTEEVNAIHNASEACFSIAEHMALLEKRIEQFSGLEKKLPIDSKAQKVFKDIRHKWAVVKQDINRQVKGYGFDVWRNLDDTQKVLSPSDFGFHNAMIKPDGSIMFFDFEYAGWDDPAKTVGDFFGQIQVSVPIDYFPILLDGIIEGIPGKEEMQKRIEILLPLFRIKWACIALNIFLPVHLARRKFSNPMLDETVLKEEQLAKAEKIIDK